MKVNTLTLSANALPEVIARIAHPPKKLYISCKDWQELAKRPALAVVGSRKLTSYGQYVTRTLATELARSGVVIVSGLAFGVDAFAHQAALEAGGLTIAVLPGGLDKIYPAAHRNLAHNIVQQGGALVTEYEQGSHIYASNFIARNRLIAGLGRAVLVTEAAEKSGTLHTAHFALEQGKDVLAVPGNITSPLSAGTNNLIKAGAVPITSATDIFHHIGLQQSVQTRSKPQGGTPQEQLIIDMLAQGMTEGSLLLAQTGLEVSAFNQALTMLEIGGKIRSLGANHWSLV